LQAFFSLRLKASNSIDWVIKKIVQLRKSIVKIEPTYFSWLPVLLVPVLLILEVLLPVIPFVGFGEEEVEIEPTPEFVPDVAEDPDLLLGCGFVEAVDEFEDDPVSLNVVTSSPDFAPDEVEFSFWFVEVVERPPVVIDSDFGTWLTSVVVAVFIV
jgi:hypothetical protein